MEHNHNHKEAFCHMYYQGKSEVGAITVRIWNSRDGVTPFYYISEEFGIELQHVAWQNDKYDPSYKPKKGDLIWRDYTDEEIIALGKARYAKIVEDVEAMKKLTAEEIVAKYGYIDVVQWGRDMTEKGEEDLVKLTQAEFAEMNHPCFELVKEDWK